jgi:hypothetical protein
MANNEICLQQVLTMKQYYSWTTYLIYHNALSNFGAIEMDGKYYPLAFEIIMRMITFPNETIFTFTNIFDNPKAIVCELAAYNYIDMFFKRTAITNNLRMKKFMNDERIATDLYAIALCILDKQFGNLQLLYGLPDNIQNHFHHDIYCHFGPPCICECTDAINYILLKYPNMFYIDGFEYDCVKLCLKISQNQYSKKYTNAILLSLFQVGIKQFLIQHAY